MTDATIDGPDKETARNASLVAKPVHVIGVLAVIVLLGAAALFIMKDSGKPGNAALSGDSPMTLLSDEAESAYSPLSPSNQELLSSVPGLVKGQNEISERISSLAISVDSLTRNLSDFKSEMDSELSDKNQTLNQLSRDAIDAQAKITSINQQLKVFNDSVSDLNKKFTSKRKSVSKPIKKKKSTPPFKLLSVQIWNSNPVAIVSHNNSQLGIGVRDKLAGWVIKSISNSGCMEASQNSETVKLCL
jgi:hypothetical protein